MEEQKELLALFTRMEAAQQKQLRYARLQFFFSIAALVCCACVLIAALTLVPKASQMLHQAENILDNVEQVSQQLADADMEGLMENLEKIMADLGDVSQQVAQADLAGLAEDMTDLVQTSQQSIEEAMDKLNAMDLQTLNKAISDLSAILKPMATFFGRFS